MDFQRELSQALQVAPDAAPTAAPPLQPADLLNLTENEIDAMLFPGSASQDQEYSHQELQLWFAQEEGQERPF